MSKRNLSNRRRAYGRRQHELGERLKTGRLEAFEDLSELALQLTTGGAEEDYEELLGEDSSMLWRAEFGVRATGGAAAR